MDGKYTNKERGMRKEIHKRIKTRVKTHRLYIKRSGVIQMNRAEKRRQAKRYNTPKKQEQLAKDMYQKARMVCEESYKKQTEKNIDTMLLALKYTLHFSELTQFGNKRLNEFMDDLMAVFNGFTTGEYNKDEYRKALLKDGIKR